MEEILGWDSGDMGSGQSFAANDYVLLGKYLKPTPDQDITPRALSCPTLSPLSLELSFDSSKSWETCWFSSLWSQDPMVSKNCIGKECKDLQVRSMHFEVSGLLSSLEMDGTRGANWNDSLMHIVVYDISPSWSMWGQGKKGAGLRLHSQFVSTDIFFLCDLCSL